MTTVYDVPPEPLIQNVATKLREMPECAQPDWALFVKTGIHKERPPTQEEWWHVRLGAVMRKVYVHGPIGIERVSSMFGGKADRGVKPNKAKKGSRSITRHAFQQLEGAGLIEKAGIRGRKLTGAGMKLMDSAAHEVETELALIRKEEEKARKKARKAAEKARKEAEKAAAEEAAAEEAAAEEAPAEEPAPEAPAEETVEAPAEEAPAEEPEKVEEAPAEESEKVEETVEETPAEEPGPVEEAPAEEAAVEEPEPSEEPEKGEEE